jgi:putative spermidine/putrescine transport system substrate-binding protein
MDAFRAGDAVIGTTWEVITNLLRAEESPAPVDIVKPKEGATGWSDTWMVNSKTKHINCAYKFLEHIVSPSVNAQIAEWFGEAPGNSKACAETADPKHCANYHADDEAFWNDVWYWQTPETTCVDGRTDVKCKGFDDWVKAWTEIKG